MLVRAGRYLLFPRYTFCSDNNNNSQDPFKGGTDYNSWVLARASNFNHNIEHLKRKNIKDRYSIHKLTNLNFMCQLATMDEKYKLTLNQKILLLAQMNHVIQVTGKRRSIYFQLNYLAILISEELRDPADLPCLGTLMTALATMRQYDQALWQYLIDNLMADKFDENYDQLFGVVVGLKKYQDNLYASNDYLTISKDSVISNIPIIYRNSLQVLRQYIAYNIFNLKECKIIFEALHFAKINEKFFWKSVRDWFNIFIKQQLAKKQIQQFFIMKESAVQKILHDHGIIRPRPILQQLSSIAFVLSQNGYISYRFLQLAQDLILYTIDHGSTLFSKYQQQIITENQQQQQPISLNKNFKTYTKQQQEHIAQMQKQYKTIFINPIQLKNQSIIYLLIVFARAQQFTINKQTDNTSFYDRNTDIYIDPNIIKWILLQLVKPQMSYTVKQLLLLYKYPKFFLNRSKLDIKTFIIHKLTNLRDKTTTFPQLKQLMNSLPTMQLDNTIPLLTNFLKRNHPSEILKMTKMIEQQKWIPYLIDYMLRLPQAVNLHDKYYSFQENCYFLYLLLEGSQYWEWGNYKGDVEVRMQYDVEVQRLKEQIKIVTYTRGFKLTVDSYFHKIMEKIDVVDFFQGGRA